MTKLFYAKADKLLKKKVVELFYGLLVYIYWFVKKWLNTLITPEILLLYV